MIFAIKGQELDNLIQITGETSPQFKQTVIGFTGKQFMKKLKYDNTEQHEICNSGEE